MNRTLAIALSLVFLMKADPAAGAIWVEAGDAGDLPSTAQTPLGLGPLEAITGTIGTVSDRDMFRIRISDPENFSASLNNDETDLTGFSDLQLFLFDANGFGIIANDEDPRDSSTFKPAFPVGTFAGPAGDYYIAMSTYDWDPYSISGEIFPDFPFDSVLGPTGPGGADAINRWDFEESPSETGPYRLELTGATYTAVPEPTGLLLLGIAASLVYQRHRMRLRPR